MWKIQVICDYIWKIFLTSLSSVQTLGKKYSSSLSKRGEADGTYFSLKTSLHICKWYVTLPHTAGKLDWPATAVVVCGLRPYRHSCLNLTHFNFLFSFQHECTQTWFLKFLWLHLPHFYLLNEHISITTNYFFCNREKIEMMIRKLVEGVFFQILLTQICSKHTWMH